MTDATKYEYVPGFINKNGNVRVGQGRIAPGHVAQFIEEGGEVLRRRVGNFEAVTLDMAPEREEN